MISVKKAAATLVAGGIAVGMVALAPAASADNYAPELPSNRVQQTAPLRLTIDGAQPGCRVTYTIENRAGKEVRGPRRTGVNEDGTATSRLITPTRPGIYSLITRVDNFPGNSGCTPTKSIQRLIVR